MFALNKKTMVSITSFLFLIAFTQIIFSQQEPNYESVYKLHLKWDIEDLDKNLMKLEKQRADSWEQLEEMQTHRNERSHITKKIEELKSQIDHLNNEANLGYHMNVGFGKLFATPSRKPIPYLPAAITRDVLELARLLYAYVLFPISMPITAFNAGKEWLSKKDNTQQIVLLEAELKKNKDKLNSLKPPTPQEVATAKAETDKIVAKIENEIAQIQSKIKDLEIERQELKHLNKFKANFKFRYI